MTDIEKIRAEILRLKDDVGIGLSAYSMGVENGAFMAYEKLLEFIDSLPEEPVSEDLEEEIEKYLDHNYYIDEEGIVCDRSHPYLEYCEDKFRKDAHHFANWQKEQMMKQLAHMPWDKAFDYIVKEAVK